MNTAARKSTRVPVSRDVNEDKKWGRFTSVVYAAMGSPPGSFQVSALRPLLEGGGIQLAEVHDLPVIGVVAHHEGLGDLAGHVQLPRPLSPRPPEYSLGPLAVTAFVQIKDADDPAVGKNFVLADVEVHGGLLSVSVGDFAAYGCGTALVEGAIRASF